MELVRKVQKTLFLDRDGVVNVEKNYLYKKEDFAFIDGIIELVKHFRSLGYLVVVVTNQSGIARGYYTKEQFLELTSWMEKEFEKQGTKIDRVYFCPHHPDISGECACRKPKPGMLLQAAKELDIDLTNSIMVGDKERDIEAGVNAGLHVTYLFDESGNTKSSKATKIVKILQEIIDAYPQ